MGGSGTGSEAVQCAKTKAGSGCSGMCSASTSSSDSHHPATGIGECIGATLPHLSIRPGITWARLRSTV